MMHPLLSLLCTAMARCCWWSLPGRRSGRCGWLCLCRCWGKQIGVAGYMHSQRFPHSRPAFEEVWQQVSSGGSGSAAGRPAPV